MAISEQTGQQIERAAERLARVAYVTALGGAGLSAENDIPVFRCPEGRWTRSSGPEMHSYQRLRSAGPPEMRGDWKESMAKQMPLRATGAVREAPCPPGDLAMPLTLIPCL